MGGWCIAFRIAMFDGDRRLGESAARFATGSAELPNDSHLGPQLLKLVGLLYCSIRVLSH